LQEAPRH